MKTNLSLLLAILFLNCIALNAQDHRIPAPAGPDSKIIIKGFSGDLLIEGYSGNEIIISSPGKDLTPPERARGLKPIYPGGTDNTGIGVSAVSEGNIVTVTCLLPFTRSQGYSFRLPENMLLDVKSGCENANDISVTGMKNEIVINNCHDIDISNGSGPVVLSSISGDITVDFSNASLSKPSSINSISGDVDVTLPAKAPADIDLHTTGGGFYSDFEITATKDNLRRIGGSNLEFSINGGGSALSIITVTGNVYLRKGN